MPGIPSSALTGRPAETPPISQASAQEQFRSLVLAAPLHTLSKDGKTYTLADVKINLVIYSAKDNTFTLLYDWVWQPGLSVSGSQGDSTTLSNDGYGHYYGTVNFNSIGGQVVSQNAIVTIK